MIAATSGQDVWSEAVLALSESSVSSTSSLHYQKILTPEDAKLLQARHQNLKMKWKLRSGRYVEDIIYEEGKKYNYDQ